MENTFFVYPHLKGKVPSLFLLFIESLYNLIHALSKVTLEKSDRNVHETREICFGFIMFSLIYILKTIFAIYCKYKKDFSMYISKKIILKCTYFCVPLLSREENNIDALKIFRIPSNIRKQALNYYVLLMQSTQPLQHPNHAQNLRKSFPPNHPLVTQSSQTSFRKNRTKARKPIQPCTLISLHTISLLLFFTQARLTYPCTT